MTRLGREAYELLLELGDNERPAQLVDERYILDSGIDFPKELVTELAGEGIVSIRSAGADDGGNAEEFGRLIRVEALGRDKLKEALAREWLLAASGASGTTPAFWHEFVDPVTGARYVVNVANASHEDDALRIAVQALAVPETRDRVRSIGRTGWEQGISAEVEGADVEIVIWKKA